MLDISVGIKGRCETSVTPDRTAAAMGSGELEVFATPAMAALMEKTAAESVKPCLDSESTTVGVSLSIEHTSATPAGMSVYCESELCSVDGRMLTFSVTAYDAAGVIGRGEHVRCIVGKDRFMQKAAAKAER